MTNAETANKKPARPRKKKVKELLPLCREGTLDDIEVLRKLWTPIAEHEFFVMYFGYELSVFGNDGLDPWTEPQPFPENQSPVQVCAAILEMVGNIESLGPIIKQHFWAFRASYDYPDVKKPMGRYGWLTVLNKAIA